MEVIDIVVSYALRVYLINDLMRNFCLMIFSRLMKIKKAHNLKLIAHSG